MFVYNYYCFPALFNINYLFLITVFHNLIILFITSYNITDGGYIHVTQIIPSFFVTFMLNFGIFFPLCKKPKKTSQYTVISRYIMAEKYISSLRARYQEQKTKKYSLFWININFHI